MSEHIYAGYCPDENNPNARDETCPACRELIRPTTPVPRHIYNELLAANAELLAAAKWKKDFPRIVCLCGSTRFMDAFFEAGWQCTLNGKIVLSVGVCKHAEHHGGEALGQDVADRLDELHLRKIDLADEVFILNVGGYIGKSTRKELEYARAKGKFVYFLEPEAAVAKADAGKRAEKNAALIDELENSNPVLDYPGKKERKE